MTNTVIALKKSSIPGSSPADLANGEIAINYADGLLFYKDSSNTIVSFDISGTFSTSQLSEDLNDFEVSLAMQTF